MVEESDVEVRPFSPSLADHEAHLPAGVLQVNQSCLCEMRFSTVFSRPWWIRTWPSCS